MIRPACRLLSILLLLPCSLLAQTVTTFEGIDASQVAHPETDVDPNGAVGTKQYVEWTNVYMQAFDKKTFAPVWSTPQSVTMPFVINNVTNCTNFNGGDGIIFFDHLASRWVVAAHSPAPNYYYCVAISSTDDLTSSSLAWYTYAFPLNAILGTNAQGVTYYPDWPKIAAWPDAYYVGIDLGDITAGYIDVGVVACALDRTNMLNGATASAPQCFPSSTPGVNYLAHSLEPADIDGTTAPPVGTPESFVSIQNPLNDGVTTTSNSINLWQFHVDWTTPANSTFMQSSVSVPVYTPGCYYAKAPANTFCVPQSTTGSLNDHIDSVGDRLMYRFAYRNFGTYQSYLVSHTVQVATGVRTQTGIRWYELRGNGIPTLYQSGTVNPDTSVFRFLPSIAQDQSGNAAVGYAVSSSSTHPSIRGAWWNLNGSTAPSELTFYNGSGDEENSTFWGDYSSMTVDPVDDCTFWYVNEYLGANQVGSGVTIWQTRISNFKAPTCGTATLSPSSLSFPTQSVGSTSTSQPMTLTNNQGVALNISGIAITGTNATSFTQTNNCGTSVVVGGSCTLNVSFAPQSSGPLSASVTVTDDAANSPQSISLSGTGTSAPTLTFSPSNASINYGSRGVGSTTPYSILATASGGTVNFSSIAITGANPTSFSEADNCVPSLASGSSCTITVSFVPGATGSFSAALGVTSNAFGSPQSFSLSGTGVVPVTLSASSIAFGNVVINTSKTANAITVTNNTSVPVTGINVSAGTPFSQTNTCGTTLAAGGQCKVTVTFSPTTTGTQSGSLTITDSASNSPQTVSLKGTGEPPLTLSPSNLYFGNVSVGNSSLPIVSTVTNNTKATVTFSSILVTGSNASDFSQTNTCSAGLAAGASCTISVTFAPTVIGARSAAVTLTDSAAGSPQAITLHGSGTAKH